MTESLRAKTAICGIGLSDFGEVPGWTHLELMAQSVDRALSDCGLKKSDIDGVFAMIEPASLPVPAVCEYLGLQPKVMEGTMLGGSSFVNFLQWAALSITNGLCDVALITYGSNARSGKLRPGGFAATPYETEYGARLITSYALAAARHMHEYGTTREHLAEVAVAARQWARKNPKAFVKEPLSVEDALAARMISDPLGLTDCCLITDGGGAVILVSAERAKDLPQKPVYLLGIAAEHSHQQIAQMADLTVTAASRSGARAFEMAGLKPKDIDLLELYDAFSINTLLFLEDMGFCEKGEGGPFLSGGCIAPGGELPVNTNGGGLSCMHPGMYGIFTIIEAVEQLRGDAGERQIENAITAIAHGNGGTLSTQVTSILGGPETI